MLFLTLPEDGVPSVSVRINDDWYSWKGWVFDKTHAPHGPMLFEMTHFTDICNWFLADEPLEVTASGNMGCSMRPSSFEYRSGALATIVDLAATEPSATAKNFTSSWAMALISPSITCWKFARRESKAFLQRPLIPWCRIDIRRSARKAESPAGSPRSVPRARRPRQRTIPALQFTAEPDKGHAHALERFVDQITGQGPEVCGVDASVLATRVAFAAIASARRRDRCC